MQPSLIKVLAAQLLAGSAIYLSSDCELIARKMKDSFLASSYFSLLPASYQGENDGTLGFVDVNAFIWERSQTVDRVVDNAEEGCWFPYNPLSVLSERDLVCEVQWKCVWRCILVRNVLNS